MPAGAASGTGAAAGADVPLRGDGGAVAREGCGVGSPPGSFAGSIADLVSGDAPLRAEKASLAEILAWCFVGASGWWSLNIITAELPFFVAELPEGERLGNLLAVCGQLGNIAPILYKVLTRKRPGNMLLVVINVFQGVAVLVLLLCAFFWRWSFALFVLTCAAGSVGCLSSVTYWAAVADRPASCVRSMSVGTTLGGLLAMGFSALQLAGCEQGKARFSPTTFFLVAATVQALQGLAFLLRSRTVSQHRPASFATGQAASAACEARAQSPPPPMPSAAKFLIAGLFFVYAVTYTMPSLQPYMAGGYSSKTERQQLLLWMLILQNAGDVIGRLATVCVTGERLIMLFYWFLMLVISFAVSAVAACRMSNWPRRSAIILLLYCYPLSMVGTTSVVGCW
eukprot:TRINITY_DN26200_c0_g1_i2.p1 TRINITY_DN26200_c0_g1~~TRINITY_DN26200_c0_g1_i2.p1  ORF type:complete len:419 (+),score=82.08 TRINITY_DN26200_c0_g1_i2:69-1259(+)